LNNVIPFSDEPENNGHQSRVINTTAERLVDSLFRQLKQVFPASDNTSLKTPEQETNAKRQWIAAFAENGISTMEQLSAGMKHARASESPFWPSPGQFIKWCKDSKVILGVNLSDVMAEFDRYAKDRERCHGVPEEFPWKHKVFYWIVCDARRAMYQRQLSRYEVEKFVQKQLEEWAGKVANGGSIPDPLAALENKEQPVQAVTQPSGKDYEYRYMPSAAMLGSVTPAQWLFQEGARRKALGLH